MSRKQQTTDETTKPACYCAAHGCPLLGVMSASTTGGSDWWCFLHFGKDAARLQAITVEINGREWLAKAITDLRRTVFGTQAWEETCKAVKHELAMQNRNDLKPHRGQTRWGWILRLESELQAMVGGTFTKQPKQTQLPVEAMQKVEFEVPGA